MEIRINLKQLVFLSVWLLITIVALLLSTTGSHMDLSDRVEIFGLLLGIFGASFTFFVFGFDFLKDAEET